MNNPLSHFEREEDQLVSDLNAGLISREEYNRALRELAREHREAAEDAAREAYDAAMDRW